MSQTHWGYGSGSVGCLFDNGPCYSGTNKRQAAYDALAIFQDDMSQDKYSEAVDTLVERGTYYFLGTTLREQVGAAVVEIFEVDPADFSDEIDNA